MLDDAAAARQRAFIDAAASFDMRFITLRLFCYITLRASCCHAAGYRHAFVMRLSAAADITPLCRHAILMRHAALR